MNLLHFPCHNNNTYLWRIGELKYLYENNLLDELTADDGCLWVRSVPELIKDSDLNEILEEESKYSKVYNSYSHYLEWDAKELAFTAWKNIGLNVPDWIYVNSIDDIRGFLEKHKHIVIRINNQYGTKSTRFLSDDNKVIIKRLERIYSTLKKELDERVIKKKNTKIIAVQFLKEDNSNKHKSIRSYVVNNKVLLSNDHGQLLNKNSIYCDNNDYMSFINRNRDLNITEEIQNDLIKASSCFNLDITSFDWILKDGKCFLLETNPYWGMGYDVYYNAFPFNGKWADRVRSYDNLPDNLRIRLNTDLFWDLIYKEFFKIINNSY